MDPGFGERKPRDLRYNYIMYINNIADLLKRRRRGGKHINTGISAHLREVWGYVLHKIN